MYVSQLSDRVATAQGKQEIWLSVFPDRENTGNLRNLIKTQEKTRGLDKTGK